MQCDLSFIFCLITFSVLIVCSASEEEVAGTNIITLKSAEDANGSPNLNVVPQGSEHGGLCSSAEVCNRSLYTSIF